MHKYHTCVFKNIIECVINIDIMDTKYNIRRNVIGVLNKTHIKNSEKEHNYGPKYDRM